MVKTENGELAQTHVEGRETWQKNVAKIELGHIMLYVEMVKQICDARPNLILADNLNDVPFSILETEQFCRMSHVGAAPGPDGTTLKLFRYFLHVTSRLMGPLYFKSAVLSIEPLAFKESTQAELYKGSGEQALVTNSRGITCANSIGKPLNSFCRQRLYNYTSLWLLDTQIGGRKGWGHGYRFACSTGLPAVGYCA